MGSLFGSSTIKGTRITEFSQTSATVGDPQPWGYGTAVFNGQVIMAALPPKEHVTKKRQGKGGVKQETYTYTMSYAIAFCKGPAFAIRWIKRNGKIVYTTDPNAPIEDKLYALKWRQKVIFHLGTETQLPDSVMEAVKGTGKVSAHRGVVYISVQDDDVTDGGGAVPSYEACITTSPPDIYLTSRPYNIALYEGMTFTLSTKPGTWLEYTIDDMSVAMTSLSGTQREIIQKYTTPPDSMGVAMAAQAGTLRSVLVQYQDWPHERMGIAPLVPLGGTHVETLIRYLNWPSERMNIASLTPLNGTLT